MAFGTGNNSITLEELRQKVSDFDIAAHYLNLSKVPCVIHSPLRPDPNPSFGFYSKDNINLKWVDFGTKESGSIYDLLSKLWNCSFKEVLSKVNSDLSQTISARGNSPILVNNNNCKRIKNEMVNNYCIKCKSREWRDYDLKYWESYGITIAWLKYAEVYPISHKIIHKDRNKYVLSADKYAYAFVEHKEGKTTLKIYQPFNKKYKWSNSHDGSVISLWTKIPQEGDRVCICSSLKDALCLWANTGIPSIAVQGEGYSISSTARDELMKRFKKVFILFDNDKPGLQDGEKLSDKTGFINKVLPPFEGGKDISDLYKSVGKEEFLRIMNNLFDSNS